MNKKYGKPIIAGNWKMNMTASEVAAYTEILKGLLPKERGVTCVICPPFPLIPGVLKAQKGTRLCTGAQNVSEHVSGAHTGEVSASMLSDLGVKYVIVGHSERRASFGETDALINKKASLVLEAGLTPIICVGESLEQRENYLTMDHITYQVKSALAGFTEEWARRSVIAYEPIWAIGTGETATAQEASEVCAHIRGIIKGSYSAKIARGMSILYGGSMNAKNAPELLAMPDIDGGLIGGASLNPEDFAAIIRAASV